MAVAQSHGSEGTASDLLVEKEHEGSGQHCLQQLGLQAFKQAQHAILPTKESQGQNTKIALNRLLSFMIINCLS